MTEMMGMMGNDGELRASSQEMTGNDRKLTGNDGK